MDKTGKRLPEVYPARRLVKRGEHEELSVADSIPDWAASFLRGNSDMASSAILSELRPLSPNKTRALKESAGRILRSSRSKADAKLRSGAARLIVALLPGTFRTLQELLSDCHSKLWYEVHFTIFSALDRDDLSKEHQERVLALIERYLMNAKVKAGYAAWKAGDLLGDEWNSPETVTILRNLIFCAKHAAGRKAALHGLEHAIGKATDSERESIFGLIRKVASADRSAEVREYATLSLRGIGCFHSASSLTIPPET